MPELPEVETVRRILKEHIVGKMIDHMDVYYEPIIQDGVSSFKDTLHDQKIIDLERYGKYLVFKFDSSVLIVHLRMEGKFYLKKDEPKEKHEHIIFWFKDGTTLRYHDVRKFGTMHLRTYDNYVNTYPLSSLGPEPKDADAASIYHVLHKKKIAVKTALLYQHIMSGLGNIYVDETLFLAKVKPTRRTDHLTRREVKLLVDAARVIIAKAISLGGSTIRSYTASLGVHGRFQNELNVHTKVGEPCPICGETIVKYKVGGRGTYACPSCQK